MLFRSSRPRRNPPPTTDSQYDTATGYSSSSFTKWPRSPVKSGLYAARNTGSIMTPSTRHTPAGRRHHNYMSGSYTDLSVNPNPQRREEPMYANLSPQRPVVNYLLPLANGTTNGTARRGTNQQNWSSLGSLNSFGDSATTPPSSQDHAGSGGSNTGASGTSTGPQRETLHSRFEFKQTLGKGTYGKVKLALDKRKNEQVAIKTIKKSRIENPHDLARIRREIDFMTSLNHPYIIKIKEVYESREKIILVMEYASGGELYDYLNRKKRIPESEARAIFRQIVSAVHFLHKNQIVHRDLKLENILIDHNGDIKLADFGLSNSWSPRRLLKTFCGSPLYASPEIVSGIPYYGPEVDCWSLGVLLYTLIYGSMPFQGGDYNRLVRNITSGDFIQPREQSGALGLIRKCLTVSPENRATIDDIATNWWVNVGYRYPPVHYYLNPNWQREGGLSSTPMGSRVSKKKLKQNANNRAKMATPPIPHPVTAPPVVSNAPKVVNGRWTDTDVKSKTNGYKPRSNRANDNPVTVPTVSKKKPEPVKSNPTTRRTINEKQNGALGLKKPSAPPSNTLICALSLIRYCLTPDASNRATTKDILRHDWLVHGPVLSLRLNSATKPTQPITSSSLSLTDPPTTVRDHDKVHYRSSVTPTTTTTTKSTYNDKSMSPTNSLLELELHTSSFFDTTKVRDNHSTTKDRQRQNRASAVVPDSTRFYSSNHSKTNSSSQNPHRRPLSLSLDNQQSNSPSDYHFALTSEKPARISSPKSSVTAPTYTRRARRTVSPTSNYENRDRYQSPTNRYTIAASPETTRRTTSPVSPSRYIVSYDFDKTLRDLKRKPIYKYIPPSTPPTTNELNVVPSLLNSTTPVAPSVFTTSSIKFAPVPTRRTSPLKDHETNLISSTRLSHNYNTIIPNSSSNPNDSITKSSAYTNPNNRRSLLNSYDLPSSTSSPPPSSSSSTAPNLRKSRLLDDNNNFISLKVHD